MMNRRQGEILCKLLCICRGNEKAVCHGNAKAEIFLTYAIWGASKNWKSKGILVTRCKIIFIQ